MKQVIQRIGLRIPSWYLMQDSILLGIVDYVQEHQKEWLLEVPRGSDGELPEVVIDSKWTGDGLISLRYTPEEVAIFRGRGVPHVNISSVTYSGVVSVLPDSIQAGRLAGQHLLGLGLTSFVYLGRLGRQYSAERFEGFKEVVNAAGFGVEDYDLAVNDLAVHERAGYMERALTKLLPRVAKPVGIFAADDLLAANVLRVADQVGIDVPSQVAVVGFNGQPIFCMSTRPSLSSVQYPGREIGYTAAQKLDRMLAGSVEAESTVVAVRNVEARESTNMLAFSDERLKGALKFIQLRAPERALQVNDVCTHLAISKSSLKDIMARGLGRSPKAEISRVREEVFKRHLEDSDLSIKEIAYKMGFPAAEEASRFFKRLTGVTPTHYRER